MALAIYSVPIFFAGLIFARGFSSCEKPDEALSANLMGAVMGGFLESISYITGIRFLMLIVIGLYAASWALVPRK